MATRRNRVADNIGQAHRLGDASLDNPAGRSIDDPLSLDAARTFPEVHPNQLAPISDRPRCCSTRRTRASRLLISTPWPSTAE